MENIGEKRTDIITKWEEKSRDFIDAFLLLFGRDGRLVSILVFVSKIILICLPLRSLTVDHLERKQRKTNASVVSTSEPKEGRQPE